MTVTVVIEKSITVDITEWLGEWSVEQVRDLAEDDDDEGYEILKSDAEYSGKVLDADQGINIDYRALQAYAEMREKEEFGGRNPSD